MIAMRTRQAAACSISGRLPMQALMRLHRAPTPEPPEDPLPGEHPIPQDEPVPSPQPENRPGQGKSWTSN